MQAPLTFFPGPQVKLSHFASALQAATHSSRSFISNYAAAVLAGVPFAPLSPAASSASSAASSSASSAAASSAASSSVASVPSVVASVASASSAFSPSSATFSSSNLISAQLPT